MTPASGLVKKLREFRGAIRGNRLQITRAADRGTRQDSAAKLSRRAVSVAGDVVENHARSRIEKAITGDEQVARADLEPHRREIE